MSSSVWESCDRTAERNIIYKKPVKKRTSGLRDVECETEMIFLSWKCTFSYHISRMWNSVYTYVKGITLRRMCYYTLLNPQYFTMTSGVWGWLGFFFSLLAEIWARSSLSRFTEESLTRLVNGNHCQRGLTAYFRPRKMNWSQSKVQWCLWSSHTAGGNSFVHFARAR